MIAGEPPRKPLPSKPHAAGPDSCPILSTIHRVSVVLDLFTAIHPVWGVTDVARELNLPKSTAHAVLSSLASTGLLQKDEIGCYRLGRRVITLAEQLVRAKMCLDASLAVIPNPGLTRRAADPRTRFPGSDTGSGSSAGGAR